jgi:hypothetical protein
MIFQTTNEHHLPLVNQSSSTILLQSFFAQKYVVHMSSFMTLECLPISTMFHTSNVVLTTPLLSRPPNTHVEHFKKVPSDPPTTWKPGKEYQKAEKIQLFLVLVLRPFQIYNLIGYQMLQKSFPKERSVSKLLVPSLYCPNRNIPPCFLGDHFACVFQLITCTMCK